MPNLPPMENIVRPFVRPSVSPLRINTRAPVPADEVECSLGGSGGRSISFQLEGGGFVFINQKNFKETSRKSTLVRVENEDDPNQFVEFCRTDKINFKENKEDKYRKTSYGGGPSPGGGTEKNSFSMQHPTDRTCRPPAEPSRGGNC